MTTCDTCGKSYQSGVQPDMFSGKKECLECLTKAHIAVMLAVLPTGDYDAGLEDEEAWEELSEWEQRFLLSIRKQLEQKDTLTDPQYHSLEKIYEKYT